MEKILSEQEKEKQNVNVRLRVQFIANFFYDKVDMAPNSLLSNEEGSLDTGSLFTAVFIASALPLLLLDYFTLH